MFKGTSSASICLDFILFQPYVSFAFSNLFLKQQTKYIKCYMSITAPLIFQVSFAFQMLIPKMP